MAQYDVHLLAGPRAAHGPVRIHMVVDLQAELFSHLPTRMVAPLIPASSLGAPIARLNPIVMVDGVRYYLIVQQAVGISTRELGAVVGSAVESCDAIKDALDLLLLGI